MNSDQHNTPTKIREMAKQVQDMTADELVNEARGPEVSFVNVREYIVAAIALIKALAESNMEGVPEEVLKKAAQREQGLVQTLQAISLFHRQHGRAGQQRENLINGVRTEYDLFFAEAAPVVAFARQNEVNDPERERKAREALDRLNEIKADSERVFAEVKQYEVNAIVAGQAKFFADEAVKYAKHALWWLWGACACGGLILGLAVLAVCRPYDPQDLVDGSTASPVPTGLTGMMVLRYLPRLLIISILFYSLAVCVRNYRAHRHNHVVNQHRAVAVKTFTVFATATTDPTVRNAILAQAASTIFTSQPSGYGADQAELSPQMTAVELIQRIAAPK